MLFSKKLSDADIRNISAILRDRRNRFHQNAVHEAYSLYLTLKSFGIKVKYMSSPTPAPLRWFSTENSTSELRSKCVEMALRLDGIKTTTTVLKDAETIFQYIQGKSKE